MLHLFFATFTQTMLARLIKIFCYFLYYGIARHLPRSYEFYSIGRLAVRFRVFLCRRLFAECGRIFVVERKADFGTGKNIVMKENACLGENARVIGMGTVTIGAHAMMGPDVLLVTDNHRFGPKEFLGYSSGTIVVGDHAWIGARAILLKDVAIGNYAIIGAGAVVSRDIPDFGIAVGNPARVIKFRNSLPGSGNSQ